MNTHKPGRWHFGHMDEYYNDFYTNVITLGDKKDDVYVQPEDIRDHIKMPKAAYGMYDRTEKNKRTRYLIPDEVDIDGVMTPSDSLMPVRVISSEKVAVSGKTYQLVRHFDPTRYTEQAVYDVRQLLDMGCAHENENPNDAFCLVVLNKTGYWRRSYFRVSGSSGLGKSGINYPYLKIRGDCVSFTPGSLPALLKFIGCRLMNLNEIHTLRTEQVEAIRPFLMDVADRKGTLTRQKLNSEEGGAMTYDLTNLSAILYYNQMFELNKPDGFFDFVFDPMIRKRIIPFCLTGRVKATPFTMDRAPLVFKEEYAQLREEMINWNRSVSYFDAGDRTSLTAMGNYRDAARGWKREIFFPNNPRWEDSWANLMEVLDRYCNSQAEFSHWESYFYGRHKRYYDMMELAQNRPGQCRYYQKSEIKNYEPKIVPSEKNEDWERLRFKLLGFCDAQFEYNDFEEFLKKQYFPEMKLADKSELAIIYDTTADKTPGTTLHPVDKVSEGSKEKKDWKKLLG